MNQKLYLIPTILLVLIVIPPESFAVSNFSVEIPRDTYVSNDNVYISGTLYAPISDTLIIKIFNADAKIISKYEIPIQINDVIFDYTLTLSGDNWTSPGLYVILAEIDGDIDSANFVFDVTQNSTIVVSEKIQTINTDDLAQLITDLLSSSVQQLDAEDLAQQIADKIVLQQQPLDTDQLVQQIADLMASSQHEIDTDKLAQQIADKIVLPQPQISQDDLSISYAYEWTIKIILIAVIFIVIVIGIILYFKKSRKKKLQNSFTPLEIKEPIAASVKLTDGSEESYEKWQIMNPQPEISTVDFWAPIENKASTGITNVSIKFIQSEQVITKADLNKVNSIPLPDLSADNYYYHSFSVSQKQITQLDTSPIFVGISICYDTGNSVNRDIQYSEVIYKISNNSISLV